MNRIRLNLLLILAFMLAWDKVEAQGESVYHKATDLYFQAKYNESLFYLDSAIRLNPEDISRFFFRAKVYERQNRYQEAIVDLTTCISKSIHDDVYLNKRAELFELTEQLDLALEDYDSSIQLRPTWYAHYKRGLIFYQLNQLQKALSDFNASIRLNSFQSDPFRARAYLKLKMEDNEGACEDMLKVFDMGFDDVRIWISQNCG